MCKSATGYTYKFLVYDGSSMNPENIMLELLDLYLRQGYDVYMDTYYSILKLSQKLTGAHLHVAERVVENICLDKTG